MFLFNERVSLRATYIPQQAGLQVVTNIQIEDAIPLLKERVPSFILLTLLQHVPAFASARARLYDAHKELWESSAAYYAKAHEFLKPEINILDLFSAMENLINKDEHLQYLSNSYLRGLSRISGAMGAPHGFELEVVNNDIVSLPAVRGFSKAASSMVLSADLKDVGTWPLHTRQYFEGLITRASGLETSADLLNPGAATKARKRVEREGQKIVKALTRPDQATPIACWVMVKVCGFPTAEIAEDLGYPERWGQIQVRQGAKLLGVKPNPGRPNRSQLPVTLWEQMDFKVGAE